MGKGIILAVIGTIILTTGLTIGITRSGLITGDTKARDEQSMLAEEAARSGLSMTQARLAREYDTFRTGLPVTPFGGGSFLTAVQGPQTGPLQVYSAGIVDGVDAQMTVMLARLATAPGALIVKSDSVSVNLSNTAALTGVDHATHAGPGDAGEGLGQADAVHGVWASSVKAANAFTDELGLTRQSRIRGIASSADVHQSALPGEHVAMLAQALPLATDVFAGPQSFTDRTFGSEDVPAIVTIDGDAEFKGGGGVGLLHIRGSLRASRDFRWQGVVIVESGGTMDVALSNSAEIVGAAYVLHTAASGTPASEDPFISLDDAPSHSGTGLFADVVSWPSIGDVTVRTSVTVPPGGTMAAPAQVSGSSLQGFLGRANIDGVDLKPSGITNVSYTGPAAMPLLDVRPPVSSTTTTTSEITLEFSATQAEPLYVYIADLDWVPMTITALDASGLPLPTVSWRKSLSVDVLWPDEGNRTTLSRGPTSATLTPSTPLGSDSEVIIDEITIPDPSAIATLRFRWDSAVNSSDYVGLAVSTESIFRPKGLLDVSITQDASVRYSAVEIGRLAARLASVRARSTIVAYDHRTEMQMDRSTARRRSEASTGSEFVYCKAGRTYDADSLMEVMVHQLEGATPGACAAP